jgi:type IV secretion system protein VirD4
VRVAFAPNRIETAKLLSDMAGTMTVHRSRRMYSGNRLSPWLFHVMASEEESQRPLLTPDEALRLADDAALVFASGRRPILAEKVRYYEDPRLQERVRIPAPETSDRLPIDGSAWLAATEDGCHKREPETHPEHRAGGEPEVAAPDAEAVGERSTPPDADEPEGYQQPAGGPDPHTVRRYSYEAERSGRATAASLAGPRKARNPRLARSRSP